MKSQILCLAFILSSISVLAGPPTEIGKTIFTARCASCHNVNKILVGPALAGVDQRRSMDWIINFVHSSQTVIKNGDKDAVALFEKFNRIPMPDHPDLKDEDIKNIVAYINAEGNTAATDKAPFAKPSKIQASYKPMSFHNYGFFLSLFGCIGILIASLLAFVKVKEYERNLR